MSYRRLYVLLDNAPRESAYIRSLHGEQASWSVTDHLLASVVDSLGVAIFYLAKLAGVSKPPKPKPLPRPGAKADKPEVVGPEGFWDALRRRRHAR